MRWMDGLASRISRLPSSNSLLQSSDLSLSAARGLADRVVAWLRFTLSAVDFVRLGVRECWQ